MGGLAWVPTTLEVSFPPSLGLESKSHPRALEKAGVTSGKATVNSNERSRNHLSAAQSPRRELLTGGKVADDSNVDRDVVFLGSRSESKGMPLKVGDLWAVEEDVLAGTGCGLFLFDLYFHDLGGVLDDLGDVCPVPGTDLAEDALIDEDDAANEPVAPKDANGVVVAVGGPVGLDHAKHAMELPVDEKDNKEMVRVPVGGEMDRWMGSDSPKALKVGATALLNCEKDHDAEGSGHDPAGDAGASGKVCAEEEDEQRADLFRLGEAEAGKVDHVCEDVDCGEKDNGPGSGLVEGDVLVKGDNVAEGRDAQQRDKVAADGQQDKCRVDMQHKGGRARNGCKG